MKTPSADLHELIHKLTQAEQRYFTLYARRHTIGNINNYEEFFDLLRRQNSYNEESAKQSWANQGHAPKDFAVHKRQLYLLILQALHEFHRGQDIAEQARTHLHQVTILLNKGLLPQADKHLKTARKLINQNQLTELQLTANRLQRRIWSKQYYKGVKPEQLQNIRDIDDKTLDRLKQEQHIKALADEMAFLHYSRMTGRDDTTTKQVNTILKEIDTLIIDDKTPVSILLDATQARATGAFVKGQYHEAWQHNKQLVEMIEQNNLTARYPDRYFSLLNNFLIDSMQIGKRDIVKTGLSKLRSLQRNPAFRKLSNLEMNIFRLGHQLELNLCLNEGQFEEAPRLAKEIDAGLKKHQSYIVPHTQITFQYLLAYLLFGQGEYDAVTDRLNIIIDDRDDQPVQDIQSFARLLNLLVLFELGQYRLLEYQIESTYRYQKRRGQLYQIEAAVINFLRKANYADEKHIRQALFQALHDRLMKLKSDSKEQVAFNYFDFLSWTQSHLQNSTFAQAFNEQRKS